MRKLDEDRPCRYPVTPIVTTHSHKPEITCLIMSCFSLVVIILLIDIIVLSSPARAPVNSPPYQAALPAPASMWAREGGEGGGL